MHARAHAHTRTHTHARAHTHTHTHTHTHARTHTHKHTHTHKPAHTHTHTHTYTHTHTHTHMYKRAQSTHKLPVHSAKGFANFSASLAMLPPTCHSNFCTHVPLCMHTHYFNPYKHMYATGTGRLSCFTGPESMDPPLTCGLWVLSLLSYWVGDLEVQLCARSARTV